MDVFKLYLCINSLYFLICFKFIDFEKGYLTSCQNGPRLPTYNTIKYARKQVKNRTDVPQGPNAFAPIDKNVTRLFEELSEKLSPYLNYEFVEEEFREKKDISDEYCYRDLSCVSSQVHLLEDLKKSSQEKLEEYENLSEEKRKFIEYVFIIK